MSREFSIIIPAHNSAAFIDKALSSIYNQDYNRNLFETIVVCDECNDNTLAVAQEYTDKTIVTDFGRDGLARQAGIEKAEGDWLLFMDDDDWWLHEYVLATLHDMTCEPFDLLLFGFIWKGVGNMSPIRTTPDGRTAYWPNVWSKMYRRKWIQQEDIRFGPERMISDLYFSKSIMRHGPVIYQLHEPLYYYNYMRVGSQTEVHNREA